MMQESGNLLLQRERSRLLSRQKCRKTNGKLQISHQKRAIDAAKQVIRKTVTA